MESKCTPEGTTTPCETIASELYRATKTQFASKLIGTNCHAGPPPGHTRIHVVRVQVDVIWAFYLKMSRSKMGVQIPSKKFGEKNEAIIYKGGALLR